MKHDLKEVSRHFQLDADYVDAAPYGTGHINDTYALQVRTARGPLRYLVQRVNHKIFKDVPRLMENIQRVTEHVRAKIAAMPGRDPQREALTIVPTTDNSSYWQDPTGNFWRCYIFIEGARTYDEVSGEGQAYEAAKAFGEFQKQLLDLPAPRLHETIPNFHHTPRRFAALETALVSDAHRRARVAQPEIEFALAHKPMTQVLIDLLEQGQLPERVTHNDTKINNVMLDDRDGRGVCVIDLDTVMPGLVLYDFGDEVRTTTCEGAEDERDLGRVKFRIDLFTALVRGYLDAARGFLTPVELEYLAFSGKLITFEIGIRFLTDFLDGDVYFKTHRPNHNLERARVQFERVRQMEAAERVMQDTVRRFC